MKVDLGIWGKLIQLALFLVVIAVMLLITMTYLPLIHQNENYRREIDQLNNEIQTQEQISEQLRKEIDALKNDPNTVERLAREKLRYARPGETIFHFQNGTTNP